MIKVQDYFGHWLTSPDVTPERQSNALKLLEAVNALMAEMEDSMMYFPTNPATRSQVSGELYGGFRPQVCTIGASHSAHKEGLAVDIYDPSDQIDRWLMKNQNLLEKYGIYIEHPDSTPRWSHWSVRPPKSGKHVFVP